MAQIYTVLDFIFMSRREESGYSSSACFLSLKLIGNKFNHCSKSTQYAMCIYRYPVEWLSLPSY